MTRAMPTREAMEGRATSREVLRSRHRHKHRNRTEDTRVVTRTMVVIRGSRKVGICFIIVGDLVAY